MYRRLSSLRNSGLPEDEADWTVCFTLRVARFNPAPAAQKLPRNQRTGCIEDCRVCESLAVLKVEQTGQSALHYASLASTRPLLLRNFRVINEPDHAIIEDEAIAQPNPATT